MKKITKKILNPARKGFQGKPTVETGFSDNQTISTNIQDTMKLLKAEFEYCSDIVFREITLQLERPLGMAFVYLSGQNKFDSNNEFILQSIMLELPKILAEDSGTESDFIQVLVSKFLPTMNVSLVDTFAALMETIFAGNIIMLLDHADKAISVSVAGPEGRVIDEPDVEPSVRGPHDGFVENIDRNIALLRSRLHTSQFKTEILVLGKLTNTKICICYVRGIASDVIVGEVKARLERFKGNGIMASGIVEELIEDEPYSIFPTIQNTERPDKVVGALLEGRVGILTDNTPNALIVPCTFVSLLQAAEDYYHRSLFATSLRILRFVALNIALLLPALYVAALSFHQEILPGPLIASLMASREGVPFPTFVEVFMMELIFEILREAGVRLPKVSGQAVSTVGGLVIGETAATAGFVSQGVLIIVALTAVANFTIPNYEAAFTIRLLRFVFLIAASVLGIPGIILGLMLVLAHLCDLRSFGVPYLSPFAPLSVGSLKDTIIRAPWWNMIYLPRFGGEKKPLRIYQNATPQKPGEQDKNNE
ncbi:spore germination protein, GerA family [Desulfosporosinus acidiphilus SJ4]|uniref:Spore germination protein, GerA family n=1 Tax=Desulfosporosinus acidiphilus (strain DSM 22704 / JCM 16185 / SJ4) TaxID=646529 RepID=I4D7L6_DESAJ|nr:spore germination protein [Desulfosporosinus acidiphilus]AFM41790.1 spore germination protein, GerA family [Desulfosporosinus acidiphilus SJ4]